MAFQVTDRDLRPALGAADRGGNISFIADFSSNRRGITLVRRSSFTKERSVRLVVRTLTRCRTGTRWIANGASRSSSRHVTPAGNSLRYRLIARSGWVFAVSKVGRREWRAPRRAPAGPHRQAAWPGCSPTRGTSNGSSPTLENTVSMALINPGAHRRWRRRHTEPGPPCGEITQPSSPRTPCYPPPGAAGVCGPRCR